MTASTICHFIDRGWLGEVVATLGLVLIVFSVVRLRRPSVAPFAVGAYIGSAYFFTSSTSFANPAVTLARTLSDTFARIAPSFVPAFIVAELVGGFLGLVIVRFLYPGTDRRVDHAIPAYSQNGGGDPSRAS